jgi:hypothetical protein
MRIGIGTRRGSFSITILLTCDIPFVFYDGMEIDNVIWGDEFQRWCDGERCRNIDVQIDVFDRISGHLWRRQTCQCRPGLDRSCGFERKLEQDRISICLTQISWTVSLIIDGCFKIFYLTWEYSKTKIGHNFLPELVRRNLNADLSLSVLK